jgi:hypothetical protein
MQGAATTQKWGVAHDGASPDATMPPQHEEAIAARGNYPYTGCMAKPLLCRISVHRWDRNWDDAGRVFLTCRRCGADRGTTSRDASKSPAS